MRLIHDYSNEKVCEHFINYYSNFFKSIGYPFTVINNPNIIVFEFRREHSYTAVQEYEISGMES